MNRNKVIKTIFDLSSAIRYVAIYHEGNLTTSVRQGLLGASSAESDKYEELIVNPALLTLIKQRGNIDCGGSRFILVGYGHFYQFIIPIQSGHLSVSIELTANYMELAERITHIVINSFK